jgi:PIN domain nuclease of toxin-antitoxin system
MNYLLDTCALIYLDSNPQAIRNEVLTMLDNAENIFISAVTSWELSLKSSLGNEDRQIKLGGSVEVFFANCFNKYGFKYLPIEFYHPYKVTELPWIHNDPFDRLLIAIAMDKDLTIVSSDKMIPKYDSVQVLW